MARSSRATSSSSTSGPNHHQRIIGRVVVGSAANLLRKAVYVLTAISAPVR